MLEYWVYIEVKGVVLKFYIALVVIIAFQCHCKTMEKNQLKRKRKRTKLRCLVCQQTFDDDYRKQHNKKYHANFLKVGTSIAYETVGAPANPFVFSQRHKKVSDNYLRLKRYGKYSYINGMQLFAIRIRPSNTNHIFMVH
jgi:hypothetical protein